ncbi:MAG: hypothetical protein WC050_01270 [Candidatus Paceibacterota bacterium]
MNFNNSNNANTKSTRKNGRWVEKPLASKVSLCACGNKYVKTRENQRKCIKCIYASNPRGVAPMAPNK